MQKDIKKVLKLVINITETHKKMVDEMSEKRGATSVSEIIRWCIVETYNKDENKNN